jgi:hypothetical protein
MQHVLLPLRYTRCNAYDVQSYLAFHLTPIQETMNAMYPACCCESIGTNIIHISIFLEMINYNTLHPVCIITITLPQIISEYLAPSNQHNRILSIPVIL